MTFANTLRELRGRALSQNRLAELAGLDHSYASRLESGSRLPSRAVVVRIADVLGLTGNDRARLFLAADYRPDEPGVWVLGVERIGGGR